MRILSINKFHYFRGGADKYFFDLSKLLESNGHTVAHFSTKSKHNVDSPFSDFFVKGFSEDEYSDATLFSKINAFINGIYSFESKKKIKELSDKFKPDIAHAYNIFYQLSPSVFVGLKKRNIPTVMSLLDAQIICGAASFYLNNKECFLCKQSNFNLLRNKCYHNNFFASMMGYLAKEMHSFSNIWNNVDKFITASNNFKNLLVTWGFNPDKIHVIPYFDPLTKENPAYELGDYALFVGRLSFEKGIDVLLESYKKINYPLVIIGEGPQRNWVEEFIKKNKMKNVTLIGFVSSKEGLVKHIRGCRFVIIPSSWYELYPLIALNSFSLGKPVIGSNSGGIPEIIENEKNGLLFEKSNSFELEKSITRLIKDDCLCLTLGKAGRQKALDEYTESKHYERILNVYKSLI
ncbi:MAG: glycosyltransferase family 4 protein [Chitinispirillaceae bacterium]